MEKEKQIIEEMAREIKHTHTEWLNKNYDGETDLSVCDYLAKHLYNADYRKVEQGEWITDDYFETIYCSLCNELAPVDCEKERFYQSNYCPNCGAHMKGN